MQFDNKQTYIQNPHGKIKKTRVCKCGNSHSRQRVTVNSRYLEVDGTIFYKFKLICTSGNLDFLKKSPQRQIMVEESHQPVFLIQINASSLAEFEKSGFEISRLYNVKIKLTDKRSSSARSDTGACRTRYGRTVRLQTSSRH